MTTPTVTEASHAGARAGTITAKSASFFGLDRSGLLEKLRSLVPTSRAFRAYFKSASAETNHLAAARAAHGGLITRSATSMSWVTAMSGLSLLIAAARETRGNPTAFAARLETLRKPANPDCRAIEHALQTFGKEEIGKRMEEALTRHNVGNAAAIARLVAAKSPEQAAAGGNPLTAARATDPDKALAELVDSLGPTLRKNPRNAAAVVTVLMEQARGSESLRRTIASIVEGSTPDQLLALLQQHLKPHLPFYASSSGAARLIYNRLITLYTEGLDKSAQLAASGHEAGMAIIEGKLRADEPVTAEEIAALGKAVQADARLNHVQRAQLIAKVCDLALANPTEASARLRDQLIGALGSLAIDTTRDAAAPLQQLRTARDQLETVRAALTEARGAKLPSGRLQLRKADAEAVAAQCTARAEELDTLITGRLLALANGNPVLAKACATQAEARNALLTCASFLFNHDAQLAAHLFNALAAPGRLTSANAATVLTGMATGDIDVFAAVLGAPVWDEARLAMLRAFTPRAAGREAGREARIDALQERLILERTLAPKLAEGFAFPRGDLTREGIAALRDAAVKQGTDPARIDLLATDWVRQSLAVTGADPGRLGPLMEAWSDAALAKSDKHIDQGFASTAEVARVGTTVARLQRNVAQNKAVAGLASLGSTENERNILKQWMLIQSIAGVTRYRPTAGGGTEVVPLGDARKDLHRSVKERAAQLLPSKTDAESVAAQRSDERDAAFQAAEAELQDKIGRATDELGVVTAARARIVGDIGNIARAANLKPAMDGEMPRIPDALAKLVDQVLDLSDRIKSFEAAALTSKDKAQVKAHQKAVADARKEQGAALEKLRHWDLTTLQPVAKKQAAIDPKWLGSLRPVRNLGLEIDKVRKHDALLSEKRAGIDRLHADLAALRKSHEDLAVRIDLQARPDSSGKEAQHVRTLILLAASELCDEYGVDVAQFDLGSQRGRILDRLRERFGVGPERFTATPERARALADLLSGGKTLAATRDAFLAERHELADYARDWMAADLRGAAQNLADNEAFTFRIGRVGSLTLAVPGAATAGIGGLSVALQARQSTEDSVKVERIAIDGRMRYRVTVMGGKASEMSAGFSAFFGTLTASLTGGNQKMEGAALVMDELAKVQDLIVKLARGDMATAGNDWPMVDSVELVSAEGRKFSVDLGATVPHPVKFFSGNAIDVDQVAATGSAGASLSLAGEGTWTVSGNARRGSYQRERRFSASASLTVFGSTGVGALDTALAKVASKVQDRTGIGSPSAAAHFDVRETTRLVTLDNALTADSEVVLTASASPAHRAQALAWVARTLSTRDATVVSKLGEWIEAGAANAAGEQSFRMVLKADAAAVTAYNIRMELADRTTDPAEAARLRKAASDDWRKALVPVRLERVRTTSANATSADGSIGNALAARALAAGPLTRRNEAEVHNEAVEEGIKFNALGQASIISREEMMASALTASTTIAAAA